MIKTITLEIPFMMDQRFTEQMQIPENDAVLYDSVNDGGIYVLMGKGIPNSGKIN